ncbi:CYFA0S07e01464g1_1 [Cyberlindnera fabianii]|uniref:CYFA0S07e01464g1_1 n=1 Tax=Cyberlindnera fabianii TaxID=36022 RepID=A0A061AW24_CYBFA|nr:CYFA0S07e01464g1_1 [Cyberlindnera fabianii]
MSALQLPALQENLENVSLDDDQFDSKPLRIMKRSTSQPFLNNSVKGLGLQTIPRRPSDNAILKNKSKNNSKVSILERPVSNDSITSSNVSDFSEEINSRNSSLTSSSVANSPRIHQHNNGSVTSLYESKLNQMAVKNSASQLSMNRLRESPSTPKLSTNFSSTMSLDSLPPNGSSSTINTLTPSQRYRLRRQNSKSSSKATIREREKYFDDVNSDDETIADGMIWNVPFTKGTAKLFSPASGKPPAMIKNIMDESPALLPMSPLPGQISGPPSPMIGRVGDSGSSFYMHQDAADSIAKFYEESSEQYVKKELKNREMSSLNLPSMVKRASELGLDDMKLMSKEKADSLSSTRPIWLPPKPTTESKKHEKDISKMLEQAAKLDKKKQEQNEILKATMEKNKHRWAELEDRGTLRNSTQYEMKKLCFKGIIPDHLRYRIWSQVMCSRLEKAKVNNDYEKYEELKEKLSKIPELPSSKVLEIEKLVSSVFVKMSQFQNGQPLNEKLTRLIKMKMISSNGLEVGDELLMSTLLLKFNEVDTYNLVNWLRLSVFDEVSMTKFNNNLHKNTVMKKYLGDREFKDDMSQLNSNMIYELLAHLEEVSTIYQLLDIAVLNNNYKIWYATFLVVLREFHFGFNDLDSLMKSDDYAYINDTNKFFERIYHFSKKF